MSYLNPPYENNFKELCAAMPLFYLDVLEMRAVLRAQGRLMDDVCAAFELIVDDNFILTADDATIRMWEDALRLPRDSSLTLDQRRRIVAGYTSGQGHIGEPEIKAITGQYTEDAIAVSFSKGLVTVAVDGEIFSEDALVGTLRRRLPAHLALKVIVRGRRVFRLELPIGYGGLAGSYIAGAPVQAGQQTYSTELRAAYAGFLEPYLYGDPPDVKESATDVLDVSGGVYSRGFVSGGMPAPAREDRLSSKGAGGAYTHTHLTSKLIEQEANEHGEL